jgi:hypothetical protein
MASNHTHEPTGTGRPWRSVVVAGPDESLNVTQRDGLAQRRHRIALSWLPAALV